MTNLKNNKKIILYSFLLVALLAIAVKFGYANAVDKLTIKIGYFGWPTEDYVEKTVFTASDLYDMGTVRNDYSYWDGSKRIAIDSSLGVPLSTILDSAGVDQGSIAQMDFWTADSGNGAFTSFTWQQLLGTKRYFFDDLAACFEYQEEDSDKPKEPEQPDKPEEPETPVTPEEPETPATPEEPENPNTPTEESNSSNITNLTKKKVLRVGASEQGRIALNKDKAWRKARKVSPMMALEESWVWYEIGSSDTKGTDNLGTANRFRLNFGQATPDEKRTFNSAKMVHTIYVMFSGKPKLTSKESKIKGKVGSKHQIKLSAAAADELLEGKIQENIVWSSSDSSIVSVDENGNLSFNKNGTATIIAKSGSVVKKFKVTVGEKDEKGNDGDDNKNGDGNGNGHNKGKGNGNGSDIKAGGSSTDSKGKNTVKSEKVKVDMSATSFVLSDAASARLRSALSRQAMTKDSSMNTHQEKMDNDAKQLVVKRQINKMAAALACINGSLALSGAVFGFLRYRKQRWGGRKWKTQ